MVFLDPDYRKWPDTDYPYCCRCQKRIRDASKAIRVNYTDEVRGWNVEQNENGTELLGRDCARKIGLI